MTDQEKIDAMINEIQSVIFLQTGESSIVNIIEIDGYKRINILIDNISSYLINFLEHNNKLT
ncbi:hypothetical protein AWE77_21480 [Escherichia coli]|nr:hypothetical protein AWE77_21480 [Escherichia coli]